MLAPTTSATGSHEGHAYRSGHSPHSQPQIPPPTALLRRHGRCRQHPWMELLTNHSGRSSGAPPDLHVSAADQSSPLSVACASFPTPAAAAPWVTRGHARSWHAMMNFQQAAPSQPEVRAAFPAPIRHAWSGSGRSAHAATLPSTASRREKYFRILTIEAATSSCANIRTVGARSSPWIGATAGSAPSAATWHCFFVSGSALFFKKNQFDTLWPNSTLEPGPGLHRRTL